MQSRVQPIIASFALMVLMSLSSFLEAVEIVAHRGASHDAPENTVASLMLGWQQQADAGEVDIRLTKDRQIVVIHDADTKRTTGASGPVAGRTMEELRVLDAGHWKGPTWKGERIPTLGEALAAVPEGKRLFIEIKCGPEVLPVLDDVLRASEKKPEQLVLIGFNQATMAKAKERFPRLAVFWVVGYDKDKKTGQPPDLDALITKAQAARFDGLDLNCRFPIDSEFVAKVRQAGLQLHVWTVDDAKVAARLVAAGVDGITTNRPGWLRQAIGTLRVPSGKSH